MTDNSLRVDILRVLSVIVGVVTVVGVCLFLFSPKGEIEAAPSPLPSPSVSATDNPEPESIAPTNVESETIEDEETYEPEFDECSKYVDSPATSSFHEDVLLYEMIRMSPPNQEMFDQLSGLATSQYLSTHQYDGSTVKDSNITISVDAVRSVILCEQDSPDSRNVMVSAFTTTTRIDDNGQIVTENLGFYSPEHISRWIRTESGYKVDQE